MWCIFLGYPPDFRGYRCLDPATGKVHISRHVTFDEHVFPFTHPHHPTQYTFLDDATPPGFTFHRPINHPVQNPVTTPYPITYSRRPRPAQTSTHPAGPLNPPTTVPVPTPSPAQNQTQPTPTTASAQPTNQHPMTTRSKSRSNHTAIHNTLSLSPVPTSYAKSLTDPNWLHAMQTEYTALQDNETWELVPRPRDHPVIRSMWLFRHKFKSDGSLERYKARLVVNGNS